eukprot:TRINITY_DN51043_c0_g1_i1.p1 TRINITY_DN51043_c0_g1~~TRINITY_DN51043_c0_g1_i1.p1  ORF type:complete len:146 (-),score=13.11 TRINITY_DN51043_c0_g1_i1:178-585(-)
MGERYWVELEHVLRQHGDKVVGLVVRLCKGSLHPNAVRSLARMLPQRLELLDVSWSLPGVAGLRLLGTALPVSLRTLHLRGCVDHGHDFAGALAEAIGRLPHLRSLCATGSWGQDGRDMWYAINAAAPEDCKVEL